MKTVRTHELIWAGIAAFVSWVVLVAFLVLTGCSTQNSGDNDSQQNQVSGITGAGSPPAPAGNVPGAATCKARFGHGGIGVNGRTVTATFEADPGDYHLAVYTPPGNGAGKLVGVARGGPGVLTVEIHNDYCGPRVFQADLGCGTPPPDAGYHGGNFSGYAKVFPLEGTGCTPGRTCKDMNPGIGLRLETLPGEVNARIRTTWNPPPGIASLTDNSIPIREALVVPGQTVEFLYLRGEEDIHQFAFLTVADEALRCDVLVPFIIPKRERECEQQGRVTVVSNQSASTGFTVKDGSTVLWSGGLTKNVPVSFVAPISGHVLKFRYREELLDTAVARCEAVQVSWQGDMTFSCSCPS